MVPPRSETPQLPARFREKSPDLHGLDAKDSWSYYRNPFVGTRQMNGLLVLQAMLGNSDLKDQQNVVYTLTDTVEGARRWYVATAFEHDTRAAQLRGRLREHPGELTATDDPEDRAGILRTVRAAKTGDRRWRWICDGLQHVHD